MAGSVGSINGLAGVPPPNIRASTGIRPSTSDIGAWPDNPPPQAATASIAIPRKKGRLGGRPFCFAVPIPESAAGCPASGGAFANVAARTNAF